MTGNFSAALEFSSHMSIRRSTSLLVLAAVGLAFTMLNACGGGDNTGSTPPTPTRISLAPFVSGLATPVGMEPANDSTGRLFVVEQGGTIRIVQNGSLLPTPFLDITAKVTSGGEMGLLGIAFHPAFAQNRRFIVHYDRTVGTQIQSVIAEYLQSATNPNAADPNSERILLTLNQPFTNHKAGQMAFGADNLLYIGFGDGGSGGDPFGNGQNKNVLLGKILRINVDSATGNLPYGIPPDNPFAAGGGAPEIWAWGFRNPWRFSFDRPTGRLFVADVGQDKFEEVDIVQAGQNYGWNTMEGMHCFNPPANCTTAGLTLPIAEYDHSEGIAVVGGYVYHGSAIPGLLNLYVFSDFGSGTIWTLQQQSSGAWTRSQLLTTNRNISSFGQDTNGELYVLDYNAGSILKLM
jgi:glucose/arabinose dehydrogenase